MADDKLDISSIFGDTFKQISDALSGETQKKKTTKKTTAKKSTSSKTSSALSSAGLKAANAGKTASKKASTAKKTTAKKTTSTSAKKTTTSSKKSGTIMLEINGRQIDFKTIESKAAKLGGDCYVVVNEKKIYNDDGKSVSLF